MCHHDVRVAVKLGTKIADQLRINFYGDYSPTTTRQLTGQDTLARADLDHDVVRRDRRPDDQASAEGWAPQEVLGEFRSPPRPVSFLGHGRRSRSWRFPRQWVTPDSRKKAASQAHITVYSYCQGRSATQVGTRAHPYEDWPRLGRTRGDVCFFPRQAPYVGCGSPAKPLRLK